MLRIEELISGSEAETAAVGARLVSELLPGDSVHILGELGAGKTTLVRGACRMLGVEGPVTSPTFMIGHRYQGRVPVAHLDLYRIAGMDDEQWGDLEPYFDGTISFVEWPEHGGGWLPGPRAVVSMGHIDANRRSIRIESDDDLRL